jgi:hypothetical protein
MPQFVEPEVEKGTKRNYSMGEIAKAQDKVIRADSPLIGHIKKSCHSNSRGDASLSKEEVTTLYKKWGRDPKGKTVTDMCTEMIQWSLINRPADLRKTLLSKKQ